jgi:hypothetical protein
MAVLVSQSTLETLRDGEGQVRTSQTTMEVLHNAAVFEVYASQTVLEVLCSLDQFSGYVSIVGTSSP